VSSRQEPPAFCRGPLKSNCSGGHARDACLANAERIGGLGTGWAPASSSVNRRPFSRSIAMVAGTPDRPHVLSLAEDAEPRMSCATFALRLPPRQPCCSPRAHLQIMLEPKVCPGHHSVMDHRRTLMARRLPMAHTPSMVRRHRVMFHRRTLTRRHPAMARLLNTVRRHPVICLCHHRTPMGRRPAMAHPTTARDLSTASHHPRTSHRRSLMERLPAMAGTPSTVRRRSTVRLRGHMSRRRVQFRAYSRARTVGV
jgi:hypothetical protein